LLGLINDVLSIAKIEAGHVALSESDFDLGALVHGVRDLLTSRARAKGLALVLEESGELPRVRGDEAKLRQVIINLVGNAIKFTGEGSVTLRASWADGAARVEVEDTGRGIDAHELDHIFEPFVQGSASAGEGGTGLGLAISRSFLRAMRAELSVQSTARKGSRFWFALELPRAAAGEAAAPERRIVGLAPGQAPVSVLVVENDRDSRELLLRLLGTVGYQVHVAIDGLAGVAAWNEQEPGLVLMDMRMPVMDGYAATRRIRELEHELRRPRIPILALTASAFDHDRPEIFAAGCDDIVAKPFREGPLLEIVARALGVRYRYQEEETAPPPTTELGPRLRSLPPDELEALHAALARGDDLAAQQAAERLAERDAWAGAEVTRMIRGFQLDELLAALESS
ncbi:MAG TPA: ATP-binding protein, partial [Planctomycetota bacterium]|nr:ATP-binding protein [Planctomycetota bacterium]